MPRSRTTPPRAAIEMLPPGWADKTHVVWIRKSVYVRRRPLLLRLGLLLAAIATGAL